MAIIKELNNGKYIALASENSLGLRKGNKEGIRIFVKIAQYETFDKTGVHTIITDLVIRGGDKTICKVTNIHWNYEEIEGQDSIIDIVENLITYIKFTTGNWKKRIDMNVLGVNTEGIILDLLVSHKTATFKIVMKRLKKEVFNFLNNQKIKKEKELSEILEGQINKICKKEGKKLSCASWINDAKIIDKTVEKRIMEIMSKKSRDISDNKELYSLGENLCKLEVVYTRKENQSYCDFLKEILKDLKK